MKTAKQCQNNLDDVTGGLNCIIGSVGSDILESLVTENKGVLNLPHECSLLSNTMLEVVLWFGAPTVFQIEIHLYH